MADHANDRPLHPSFFEGRVLVEILSWEWALGVGVSRFAPHKRRSQPGLDISRTIWVQGRIQAPQQDRGRDIRVLFYPFGPDILSGKSVSVGALSLFRSAPEPRDYDEASLLLPEADLAMLAIALSTTTKYLHIWTSGLDVDVARITNYSLSATIGKKVKPWAGVG